MMFFLLLNNSHKVYLCMKPSYVISYFNSGLISNTLEAAPIYIIRGWHAGWHGPHAVFIHSEYALSCPSAGARHQWHLNFTHCYLSGIHWTADSIFCGYKYNMQPQHSVSQCVQAEIWSEHLSSTSLMH